jgi:hypothetical protein
MTHLNARFRITALKTHLNIPLASLCVWSHCEYATAIRRLSMSVLNPFPGLNLALKHNGMFKPFAPFGSTLPLVTAPDGAWSATFVAKMSFSSSGAIRQSFQLMARTAY